jgi:hypothetical protein
MPALLIKDLPENLHRKLKEEAEKNHRSMNRQVISMLEEKLGQRKPVSFSPPVKLKKPVSGEWIVKIIREARDSR